MQGVGVTHLGQGAWKLLEKQVWGMGGPLGPGGTAGSRRSGGSRRLSRRSPGSSQTPGQRWPWGSRHRGRRPSTLAGLPTRTLLADTSSTAPGTVPCGGKRTLRWAGAFRDLDSSGPCSPGGLPARGDPSGVSEAGLRIVGREGRHGPSSRPRPDTRALGTGTEPAGLSITTSRPSPLPGGESRLSPEPSHLDPRASPVPRPDHPGGMSAPGMTPAEASKGRGARCAATPTPQLWCS